MKNVVYDLFTGYIKGINREPLAAEIIIDLPYAINLSKVVEEATGNMVQKVDENGELLFKTNVTMDEFGNGTYDETIESTEVLRYENVVNTYKIATEEFTVEIITNEDGTISEVEIPTYQEIITESQVPVEIIENEPIMIPEIIIKTYSIEQNPFLFTKDEVIEARDKSIIDNANLPPTEVEILQEDTALLWYEIMQIGGV